MGTPLRTPCLATFGAGCFWGVEEAFRKLPGVIATAVGYMGGNVQYPTYEDVCSHGTGHAEVVHIEFDPGKIPYEKLLEIFFSSHNPTTRNRQGPDIGSQYRSVIFFHDKDQQSQAENKKQELSNSGRLRSEIVTEIEPAQHFWKAEEYHQQYLMKQGRDSCHL